MKYNQSTTTIDEKSVLLRRSFTFRQKKFLLLGLGLLAAVIFAITIGVLGIIEGRKVNHLAVAFTSLPLSVVSFMGVWLIVGYATARTRELLITHTGIVYGRASWSWNQIKWIAARRYNAGWNWTLRDAHGGLNLEIQLNGFWGRQIPLTVDELMTQSEYDKLAAELLELGRENFPSLKVMPPSS